MLRQLAKTITSFTLNQCKQRRNISLTACMRSRVTIIGMGGVGQALSLLLKMNPRVTSMHLHDLKDVTPYVVDLNHIDRYSTVKGFKGPEQLNDALFCTDLLVIAAGQVRTECGQTRDDLLKENACIVGEIIEAAALECPRALIVIITNPINSLVPMAAEILKKYNVYDPRRLFGLTMLDTVRTKAFLADAIIWDPTRIKVPVIGGHSAQTMVPILSECQPLLRVEDEVLEEVIKRIKLGGEAVIEARNGDGSAQLCTAYAAKLLCDALLDGLKNAGGAISIALIDSDKTQVPFFSSWFYLYDEGIKEILPLPEMNDCEKKRLCQALVCLEKDIKKGVDMAKSKFGGPPKTKECKK